MKGNSVGAREGKLGAVIVFYHPADDCIAHASQLARLVDRVVVVENTPDVSAQCYEGKFPENVDVIANGANVGIAIALNQGIDALVGAGHRYALLFDQDSVATPELIDGIASYFGDSRFDSGEVALVGPAYFDARFGRRTPFMRFAPFRAQFIEPAGGDPIDVDFLITSGSCIDLRYWQSIGPMENELFIDFVDVEWCLRAKRKGFRIVGLPWLTLTHSLGEEPIRLGWRYYPLHNITRRYYQVRNVVNLLLRPHVSWVWKSREMLRLPVRLVIYSIWSGGSVAGNTRMIAKAFCDGVRGRLGPLA